MKPKVKRVILTALFCIIVCQSIHAGILSISFKSANYKTDIICLKIKNNSNKTVTLGQYMGTKDDDYVWGEKLWLSTKSRRGLSSQTIQPKKTTMVYYSDIYNRKTRTLWYTQQLIIPFKCGSANYTAFGEYDNEADGHNYDFIVKKKKTAIRSYSAGATYKKFSLVKNGMSYRKVCDIMGFDGTLNTSSGSLKIYTWDGVDDFS